VSCGALLCQHHGLLLLLWLLCGPGAFGRGLGCLLGHLGLVALLVLVIGRGLRGLLRLPAVTGEYSGDARHDADDTADRSAQHAADRTGRFVTFAGALLDALDESLRVHDPRRVENDDRGHPKRDAQFHTRTQLRCRAGHCSVSNIDPDIKLAEFWGMAGALSDSDFIASAPDSSTVARRRVRRQDFAKRALRCGRRLVSAQHLSERTRCGRMTLCAAIFGPALAVRCER